MSPLYYWIAAFAHAFFHAQHLLGTKNIIIGGIYDINTCMCLQKFVITD